MSVHRRSGVGAWAAGSASRMPALAGAVPGWVDCVSIFVDTDADGRKHAAALAEGLRKRRIHVDLIPAGSEVA